MPLMQRQEQLLLQRVLPPRRGSQISFGRLKCSLRSFQELQIGEVIAHLIDFCYLKYIS